MGDARPFDVEIPSCTICFGDYGQGLRRPWDLGCGHCICGRCYASLSVSGPRLCPVDRSEWSNPHIAYELLNIVEQLHKVRGRAAQGDDDTLLPTALLLESQRPGARRWRLPDPFRPAADALALLSDLWRAALWPEAGGGGGGGDGGLGLLAAGELGTRELIGHLAVAAPPWAHAAWRVVTPGLAVLGTYFAWRSIVAVALLLLPAFLATSAAFEASHRTWPILAACAASALLGSASCMPALLACGLLQQLLAASLLATLGLGVQHSRACDCLMARLMRRRLLRSAFLAAALGLCWLGTPSPQRRVTLAVLAAPAGAVLRAAAWMGWVGAGERGGRVAAVAAAWERVAAAAASAGAPASAPLGLWRALWLLARCGLPAVALLLTLSALEDYRGSLPEGGPDELPPERPYGAYGSARTGGGGGVLSLLGLSPRCPASRYDLDWLLLRGAVFLGALCCTGSLRYATMSNMALHGGFQLLRLAMLNRKVLSLFRDESAAAAAPSTATGHGRAAGGSGGSSASHRVGGRVLWRPQAAGGGGGGAGSRGTGAPAGPAARAGQPSGSHRTNRVSLPVAAGVPVASTADGGERNADSPAEAGGGGGADAGGGGDGGSVSASAALPPGSAATAASAAAEEEAVTTGASAEPGASANAREQGSAGVSTAASASATALLEAHDEAGADAGPTGTSAAHARTSGVLAGEQGPDVGQQSTPLQASPTPSSAQQHSSSVELAAAEAEGQEPQKGDELQGQAQQQAIAGRPGTMLHANKVHSGPEEQGPMGQSQAASSTSVVVSATPAPLTITAHEQTVDADRPSSGEGTSPSGQQPEGGSGAAGPAMGVPSTGGFSFVFGAGGSGLGGTAQTAASAARSSGADAAGSGAPSYSGAAGAAVESGGAGARRGGSGVGWSRLPPAAAVSRTATAAAAASQVPTAAAATARPAPAPSRTVRPQPASRDPHAPASGAGASSRGHGGGSRASRASRGAAGAAAPAVGVVTAVPRPSRASGGGRAAASDDSILSPVGPPRGQMFDDVVWTGTAVILAQWVLLVPPWSEAARWAGGWGGWLSPRKLLLWACIVGAAGLGGQLFRLSSEGRLKGAVRPCAVVRGRGGAAGAAFDVVEWLRYMMCVAAVPYMARLLGVLSRRLPYIHLALATNAELAARLATVVLQAVGFMAPLPLSGPPLLPLLCPRLARDGDPLPASPPWTLCVAPRQRLRIVRAAAATRIFLGFDPALAQWLALMAEGGLLMTATAWEEAFGAAAAEADGDGVGAGGAGAGVCARARAVHRAASALLSSAFDSVLSELPAHERRALRAAPLHCLRRLLHVFPLAAVETSWGTGFDAPARRPTASAEAEADAEEASSSSSSEWEVEAMTRYDSRGRRRGGADGDSDGDRGVVVTAQRALPTGPYRRRLSVRRAGGPAAAEATAAASAAPAAPPPSPPAPAQPRGPAAASTAEPTGDEKTANLAARRPTRLLPNIMQPSPMPNSSDAARSPQSGASPSPDASAPQHSSAPTGEATSPAAAAAPSSAQAPAQEATTDAGSPQGDLSRTVSEPAPASPAEASAAVAPGAAEADGSGPAEARVQ